MSLCIYTRCCEWLHAPWHTLSPHITHTHTYSQWLDIPVHIYPRLWIASYPIAHSITHTHTHTHTHSDLISLCIYPMLWIASYPIALSFSAHHHHHTQSHTYIHTHSDLMSLCIYPMLWIASYPMAHSFAMRQAVDPLKRMPFWQYMSNIDPLSQTSVSSSMPPWSRDVFAPRR
jgi:hypothetical protein